MFTAMDKLMLVEAVNIKLQSLRRGVNTSRSPEFKALFERQVSDYSGLHLKLSAMEVTNGQVQEGDGTRKKP